MVTLQQKRDPILHFRIRSLHYFLISDLVTASQLPDLVKDHLLLEGEEDAGSYEAGDEGYKSCESVAVLGL